MQTFSLEATQIPRTSRAEELLCCNHPPSDTEVADYQHVVDEFPVVLASLDEQISKAQEALDHLLRMRENARCRLNDAKTILHPIRSLPADVLGEIFRHCTPSWYADNQNSAVDTLDPHGSPWLISHICRRWRTQVLSSPNLWSFLQLKFDKHATYISRTQCVYKTYLCLERSKTCRLSVSLASFNGIESHPVLGLLQANVGRWEHLSTALPAESLQCFAGIPFSALQRLKIELERPPHGTVVDIFASASNLVSLRPVKSSNPLRCVDFPWARLTEFQFAKAYSSSGLLALRKMIRLQKLSLAIGKPSKDSRIDEPIRLPELSELQLNETSLLASLTEPSETLLKDFFEALEVPLLVHLYMTFLTISNRIIHFPSSNSALSTIIKLSVMFRSDMHGHPDNGARLLAFLSLTPHVVELKFEGVRVTEQLVLGLHSTERLPRLRVLDVNECSFDDDILPAFCDMLETRCRVQPKPIDAAEADEGNTATTTMELDALHVEGSGEEDTGEVSTSLCNLEKVCVPRWMYFSKLQRWRDILGAIEVDCGTTQADNDNEGLSYIHDDT